MDTDFTEKRTRGRPRKRPLPTVVAKSTIIRRTVPTGNDSFGTEVVQSSLNFAGDNAIPVIRSSSDAGASGSLTTGAEAIPGVTVPAQPKRRGRPPKNKTADAPQPAREGASERAQAVSEPLSLFFEPQEEPRPKRRGRPPKNRTEPVSAPKPAEAEQKTVRTDVDAARPLVRRIKPEAFSLIDPVVSDGIAPANFKGPGVRLGKELQVGDSRLSFFYIVFKNPEHDELLYPDTMHSIQHLLSGAAKEADLPNIIKIMPCGSRIAMEVAVLDAQSDFAKHELRKLMLTAAYMDNIPKSELTHCTNPRYQNFFDAHREICEFVETMYGITVDSRSGDYSW
ncbi:MAG: S-ribosylhomocysteine lyase [Clostridia bacterium]|nr:S-ribosylhomocysteine lyase [Clostridia bacterium]